MGVLETLGGRFTFPLPPSSLGPGPAKIKNQQKTSGFIRFSSPDPQKPHTPRGGVPRGLEHPWSKKLSVLTWGLTLMSQIVEFSHARGPDRRVFSRSWARSSSFLMLTSQIIEFSHCRGPDHRVFSCSRARSSSFLMVTGRIIDFSRAQASN